MSSRILLVEHEHEVLILLARGSTNQGMQKFRFQTRAELVDYALGNALLES